MTTTVTVVTRASVGLPVGPPDGYLVSVAFTTGAGQQYVAPDWDPARKAYRDGFFTLSDATGKALVSFSLQSTPVIGGLTKMSIPFVGDLICAACPAGPGAYTVTTSDVPVFARSGTYRPPPVPMDVSTPDRPRVLIGR